jgi:S-adenosyl methyltransferase
MPVAARCGPGEPGVHHPRCHLGGPAGDPPVRRPRHRRARASLGQPPGPRRHPSVRLVYIDNDPLVTAQARARLVADDGAAFVEANLTDPAAVLADPAFRAVIDMAEPVCLVFSLVLTIMPARQAREVAAAYADLAAPGSLVVVSCAGSTTRDCGKNSATRIPPRTSTTTRPARWKVSSPAWSSSPRGSSRRRTGAAAGMTCPRPRRDLRTRSALPRKPLPGTAGYRHGVRFAPLVRCRLISRVCAAGARPSVPRLWRAGTRHGVVRQTGQSTSGRGRSCAPLPESS